MSLETSVVYVYIYVVMKFFFFFKQKTAYEMRISDWSSDVCSSDLAVIKTREAISREGVCIVRKIRVGPRLHHPGWVYISLGPGYSRPSSRPLPISRSERALTIELSRITVFRCFGSLARLTSSRGSAWVS